MGAPIRLELLEERMAPAHVDLPASVAHVAAALPGAEQFPHDSFPAQGFGHSAAAEHNPHFSGKLRPLPFIDPTTGL